MAINNVLVQVEEVVYTTTSLTLGYGSGQTVPPRYIVCNPTAAMTITLPLSTPTLPTSSSTQYIPGSGPGFPITIYNNSSTPYTITIAAAAGDTLTNVVNLTAQGDSISVFSSPSENVWYGYERSAGSTTANSFVTAPVTATSTSFTMFTADQSYVVTSASAVWGTASSSAGLQLEKATGTTATGSGTALLTATINTAGTANTVTAGTLIATTASLTFASGNRLNIVVSGSTLSLANCVVTVGLRRVL